MIENYLSCDTAGVCGRVEGVRGGRAEDVKKKRVKRETT